jgi:flagellar protein FlaJ
MSAAQPPASGIRADIRNTLVRLTDAYRTMEIPARQYVLQYVVPSLLISLVAVAVYTLYDFPARVEYPLLILAVFAPIVALVYPRVLIARKRSEIDKKFFMFVTDATVLSMTNTNRIDIFRALANDDDYGALAEELRYLVALIETFNMSLDDACRQRSKHVSSELLSDFYSRLAYNVGAGQSIAEFLDDEQDAIRSEFTTKYTSDLERMSVMTELFMSIVLAAVFAIMFAAIIPFLTGAQPIVLLGTVIVIFLVLQVLFMFLVDTFSPDDPLWFQPSSLFVQRNRRMIYSLGGGISATILLSVPVATVLLGLGPVSADLLPYQIWVALPTTPLFVPGVYIWYVERQVERADKQFPSFIRGLGAIEGVKQTSTSNVLKTLREKDFGSLTPHIDSLYKRLNIRIDTDEAWHHFASETGSYLIQNFGGMYVGGRTMGGDPDQLGKVISRNFNTVLELREHRSQAGSTMTGMFYGLAVASAFSFFVCIEVIRLLIEIAAGLGTNQGVASTLLNAGIYDLPLIKLLIVGAIVVNAGLAAVIIQKARRRFMGGAVLHFVVIVWMCMLAGVVTHWAAVRYLSFG